MSDRESAALVALGEVRYVGVGTDGDGRDTWDYRCLACGQKWHLREPLPRTRGHRCSDRLDNHYGGCDACGARRGEECRTDQGHPVPYVHVGRGEVGLPCCGHKHAQHLDPSYSGYGNTERCGCCTQAAASSPVREP